MKIVAVTACPTGIAHTYMAQAALIKKAKELGHEIHVETQGSMGIENELKKSDIKEADIVILAVGCAVDKMERFEDKLIVKVEVGEVISKPDEIFKVVKEKVGK